MKEQTKQFSIDDIELFRRDDDIDFVHVKLWALAEGNNSHQNPIDFDILQRDAHTALGKFIVGKFDKWDADVTTHVLDEVILGYVTPNQEVTFEEKDGKRFITVSGVLSKIYATDVVKMFKNGSDKREVSCEFSCLEGEEDNLGNVPILGYTIHGITILGLKFKASCEGAEIKIMKFAEEFSKDISLESFAKKRKNNLNKKSKTNSIKEEIVGNKEEKMEKVDKNFSEPEKEKEEDIVMEKDKGEGVADPKPDEKEKEKVVKEKKEEPKKFSLDAYADGGALMAMLEAETENSKALAQKILKEMSAEEIVMGFVAISKELAELKEEKNKAEKEKTDKKLFSIMTPAKENLAVDMFVKLYEEGRNLSYNELDGFNNKVKAFVDENKITKDADDGIMKFASSDNILKEQNNIDVFEKISRK